ncbi:MAG: PorV/PorQ family protein [Planctomycetia bacterium]|nr:PorV/PorQ family protein [Planctomycetia bacterium]
MTSLILSQNKVGTTAAAFLNIPGGARTTGMGGAYAAVSNDAMAIFSNVAGICQVDQSQVGFNTADWFVDTNLNHWAAVLKLGSHYLGLSMKELDYGNEIVTTVENPEGSGEKWTANDQMLGLSYATRLTDRFSLGGTFKFVSQEIYHESARTVAIDVGLLFKSDFRNLRIGMSINNFGLDAKLDGKDLLQVVDIDDVNSGNNENISAKLVTDKWPLPLLFTVGLAADLIENEWLYWQLAIDALHPNNNNSYVRLGTEIAINRILYVRFGHSAVFKKNSEEGLSFGVGLRYTLGTINFRFDYATTIFGRLGIIPQLGILIII